MAAQPPVQTKEQAIAAMREAEEAALQQLKADPTGSSNRDAIEREDAELVAMLAGSTAQTLKTSRFADNVASSVNAPVLDAKQVVTQFVKGTQNQSIQRSENRPVLRTPEVKTVEEQKIDSQLELDLYKKMDMTDVYNILSEIKDKITGIENVQREIQAFMRAIQNS